MCRYYEFEVVTTGYMKVGFAKTTMEAGVELGVDGSSYAFDGHQVRALASLAIHNNSTSMNANLNCCNIFTSDISGPEMAARG